MVIVTNTGALIMIYTPLSAGLPIITHTGTSWGYGALVTLVPDLHLAIHTSITGPDTGYKGRRNIHMYIMDLLMDKVMFAVSILWVLFKTIWFMYGVTVSPYWMSLLHST